MIPNMASCSQCAKIASFANGGGGDAVLWETELFVCVHKRPPCGVVGHLQLLSKRHFQGPSAFTDEEAAAIGPALRACERALEEVTGCDRVYTAALGSPKAPHFHAHMIPFYVAGKGSGTPPIAVTNTPFDVFLQEKLAGEPEATRAAGAQADEAKCKEVAQLFKAKMAVSACWACKPPGAAAAGASGASELALEESSAKRQKT